jgi:hypothetical protein
VSLQREAASAHQPDQASWRCLSCPVNWPCPRRRAELRQLYRDAPESLHLYLTRYFIDAAASTLRHQPAGLVYDQFLGWTVTNGARPSRRAAQAADSTTTH